MTDATDTTEPWHDTPEHVVDGEVCGPVIVTDPDWYHCLTCGQNMGESLSCLDRARADAACAAWDTECERQEEAERMQREYDRKVPLLAEAIARRKANMAREQGSTWPHQSRIRS